MRGKIENRFLVHLASTQGGVGGGWSCVRLPAGWYEDCRSTKLLILCLIGQLEHPNCQLFARCFFFFLLLALLICVFKSYWSVNTLLFFLLLFMCFLLCVFHVWKKGCLHRLSDLPVSCMPRHNSIQAVQVRVWSNTMFCAYRTLKVTKRPGRNTTQVWFRLFTD